MELALGSFAHMAVCFVCCPYLCCGYCTVQKMRMNQ